MATLNVSYDNGVVYYYGGGFTPGASATVTVLETGGYLTTTVDSGGNISGSFQDTDPAGTYTLDVTDSSGVEVRAFFTIPGGTPPPAPYLIASWANGVVSFNFSNFTPYAQVTVTVEETGGYVTVTADASGNGSGTFQDNDAAGYYTLEAIDGYGDTATAIFQITSSTPPPTNAWVQATSAQLTISIAYGGTTTAGWVQATSTQLTISLTFGVSSGAGWVLAPSAEKVISISYSVAEGAWVLASSADRTISISYPGAKPPPGGGGSSSSVLPLVLVGLGAAVVVVLAVPKSRQAVTSAAGKAYTAVRTKAKQMVGSGV